MRIRIAAIGTLLVLTAMVAVAVQNGNDLYQQGLARETAGDLQGAMQIFERIVRDFSSNRALSARALLQLGRLWELLEPNQARRYYERVVREFAGPPDQSEIVAQARSRLQALTPPLEDKRTGMIVRPFSEIIGGGELLAVSPDGTKAIVMDYSKGENLALFEFASRRKRLLTDLNWLMGTTSFPVWSPDSRRVAFQRVASRLEQVMEPAFELRVMTLDGQSNVVYRSEEILGVQPVGWTPDGATLVVVITRLDRTWALGTLPVTGASFTPLRSFSGSNDRNAMPRLSRDGRFIAYLEGEVGQRDVHVVSIDGREVHRITDDTGDDFAPMWSPDGGRLAFIGNRLGAFSLWTVVVKNGKPVGSAVKLKDDMHSAVPIDWTERGILYHQLTATWDLYTAPVDPVDGHSTGSPRLIPYSRTGRNDRPVWSPDGGTLAFVSSAAVQPNRRSVVAMPANGGQAREFLIPTTNWANPRGPFDLRWFGDGRGLGFSGTDTRGVPAVFRLLLETGEWDTIPLSEEESALWTEWNTDGSSFYFARLKGSNAGIFERGANGGAERPVYRPSAPVIAITSLEFGPDRKSLAFELRTAEANYKGRTRMLVLDVGTGKTRTVIEDVIDLADFWPLNLMGWTPSGDLMVRRYRGAFTETLVVPVSGGPPRPVAIPTFNPTQAPFAKWSPDGRSMVLSRVNGGWETILIENPLAAVHAVTVSR